MCGIVQDERSGKNIVGNSLVAPFVNSKGMINTEGLLPLLASFPTFDSAMNFIMAVKPGFRYTPQFQKFLNRHITVTHPTQYATLYTLDKYEYQIGHIPEDKYYSIEYFKDGKLHRINGPAEITISFDEDEGQFLNYKWYRLGKLYQTETQPHEIIFAPKKFRIITLHEFDQEPTELIVDYHKRENWYDTDMNEIMLVKYYDVNGEYIIREIVDSLHGSTEKYVNGVLRQISTLTNKIEKIRYYDNQSRIVYTEQYKRRGSKGRYIWYNPDGTIRETKED